MRALTAAGLLVLSLALPAVAPAQDAEPAPEPRIADGTRAGHVDVGGLTIAEAAAKLERVLGPRYARGIVVRAAKRRWRLGPGRARFAIRSRRTAREAYAAAPAPAPVPAPPEEPEEPAAETTAAGVDVPLRVRFSRAAVREFVARIDRRADVAPRNARLRFAVRRMILRPGRPGRDLDARRLRERVVRAFRDPAAPRVLRAGRRWVKPAVNRRDLRRRHPTVITIHRAGFRLRLFKRLRLSRSYGIAVGAAGYETPTGLYAIQNKAVDPVWNAPNAPWAGVYAGRSIPGGAAENPLKARWLGIVNGVGIHGTAAEYSIGSRASHGCIRMRVRDVIDLYPRVPVGTPVYIR